VCPTLLTWNIAVAGNARSGITNDNLPRGYPSDIGLWILSCAVGIGCFLMFVFVSRLATTRAPSAAGLWWMNVWLWAGPLFIGGVALCPAWFRLRVRQMDELRRGDMPLEALRSHALSQAQPSQWKRFWK
jgi:hypothetical protein